jgi:hypothetical protein
MDHASEQLVTQMLGDAFPRYGILGKKVLDRAVFMNAAGSLTPWMVPPIIYMVIRYTGLDSLEKQGRLPWG